MITKHKIDPWACMPMLGTVEFFKDSSWGKKDKSKKAREKKGKFDWLKNIFKKSEKEKK